jgi:flavin-binding protein dodecin
MCKGYVLKTRYGVYGARKSFENTPEWEKFKNLENIIEWSDKMTVVKIIEVLGASEKSWDDAVQQALDRTAETISNIVGIDVLGYSASVKNKKIVEYKADVKIAFLVNPE